MARGRQANLVQSKLSMILFGDKFTGKSTLASQLAYFKNKDGSPFKVLYIDPESGSIDDYVEEMIGAGVNPEDLYILYTQSMAEVREYIRKVRDDEDLYLLDDDGNETDDLVIDSSGKPFRADAIVIDGASILNMTTKHGLLEFSKRRASVKAKADNLVGDDRVVKVEGAGLELKDYQTINFTGQELVLDLNGCGKHYIVTARETNEMVTKLDSNGKEVRVATGKKIPEGFKEMDYNAKTVIWMHRDDEDYGTVKAYIQKDRTGVHNAGEDIEDPTLLDWQKVIDRTGNHQAYAIKNTLNEAIKAEENNYTRKYGGVETEDNEKAAKDICGELSASILTLLKNQSAPMKKKIKDSLTKNGLPITFGNVTDAELLAKVKEHVETVIADG